MEHLLRYDRPAAVAYAHRWAYGRNPRYYDYERVGRLHQLCLPMPVRRGGDHELHAGPGLVLSGRQPQGSSLDGRALLLPISDPERAQPGPGGGPGSAGAAASGDFVQLRFDAPEFGHTPVVVEVGSPPALDRILVAAHSQDADLRPSKYLLLPGDPGDPYSGRALLNSYLSLCRGHSDEEMLSLAVHFESQHKI